MLQTKDDLFKIYVKNLKSRIGNFDLKVQTSAILCNFFVSKGYDFYFAPKLTKNDGGNVLNRTPDFQAHKLEKFDIIGEIKQGLPNPHSEEYEKKVNKDILQLELYSGELAEISTPHDVFFSSPSWCNEAIAYYVEKISKHDLLNKHTVVLKYHWMKGNNHSQLTINKVFGNFSDPELNQEFLYKDYQVGEGELADIQGYYKILYTEEEYNGTPVEYIMLVLWHNIFPELIKTSEYDKTMERIKLGGNTLRFKLDEIMPIIDNIYTLKTSVSKTTKQFSKEMIIDAMEGFVSIKKAQKLNDSKDNPEYIMTHSKISTRDDFITYLITELHKEEFEKKADIEYQRQYHKDLSQPS